MENNTIVFKNLNTTYGEFEKALLLLNFNKVKSDGFFRWENPQTGTILRTPIHLKPKDKLFFVDVLGTADLLEIHGVLANKFDFAEMIKQARIAASKAVA